VGSPSKPSAPPAAAAAEGKQRGFGGWLHARTGLVGAIVACAVAAGLALLAVGRGWVSYVVAAPPLPSLHEVASGHDVAAAVTPLALVVLAGVVAFPATHALGRRFAGSVVALAGIGLLITPLMVLVAPDASVKSAAVRVAGRSDVRPSGVAPNGWPWLVMVCALLAVFAGTVAVGFSADWPAMGRRYESASGTRASGAGELSMWDRLDRGDDPTI
jgi:uncharacterized membrane protein (TIGR02234 family)